MDSISHKNAKNKVNLTEFRVENTSETDFPDTYGDDDDLWSHEKFKSKFKVVVVKLDKLEMEVDLIGLSCSVANAFRRILLSEVPSMAIEKVYVSNNTSLVKDEVLAHRLGLIPLRADPRLFEYRPNNVEEGSENDTLEFELKMKCIINNEGSKNSTLPDEMYKNHVVYSKHLKWLPLGGQAGIYRDKDVRPVHGDILLDRLRPGQEIDLKVQAVKGVGKDHAKFSPVATAFYRMMPEIKLLREVEGESAVRLQKCFSPGVIGLETSANGEKKAVVLDPRYDSCSRNVFKYDDLKDAVRLSRIRNHFIFSVESVGALPPDILFLEAVEILQKKCRAYLTELDSKRSNRR